MWSDAERRAVKPSQPNGVKLETFIFDVFHLAGSTFGVFEVRTRSFAMKFDACNQSHQLTGGVSTLPHAPLEGQHVGCSKSRQLFGCHFS